ncbi:MAG TPA: dienelactone hydrolase family protein [Chthoniobacteraceae bacterium]|jgi:carboxymethylenebutenolidase|nr:dienelactone hydrolase family protein [Chthoniobacteraceae bacterium]
MKPFLAPLVLLALAATAAAQDWAKERLEKTPRHLEWVKVKSGDREVNCSIAFPEVKEKATAVIVIHEIFGLTDWVRGVTDQLAEAGFIAIAPDLLSGMAPGGGGTPEFGAGDAVRKAIQTLPPDQVTADLNAVLKHVTKLPAANGKVAIGGFCWGGTQAFRFATNNQEIGAAFVFYGSGPEDAAELGRIKAPVYGFYGENDARINATIPKSTELMKAAGKTYDPVIYTGAGHGFMRAGEAPDANEPNKKARVDGWQRWTDLLKKL